MNIIFRFFEMESNDSSLMECCTIAKVYVNGNDNDPHYIIGLWGDDVKLTLVRKDEYWRGKLAPERFSHYYEELNISKEQYLINTKRALTTNSKDNEYSFKFTEHQLIMKKTEIDVNITLQHGIVDFNEHFKEGGNTLLIDTLLQMKELSDKKLKHQESESEELERNLRSVIGKCEEFSKLKQVMEEDLYVKFMTLLNNKKDHCAKMEEFIAGVTGGNKTLFF